MLENEVFNRPYVRDTTKTCECACSVTCNPDIITNADRIRAMSNEELAHLLCFEGWQMSEVQECLTWLQQPAKEDT